MEELQAAYDEEKKKTAQLTQRVVDLETILLNDTKINEWRQLNCIDECKVSKYYQGLLVFSNGYIVLFHSDHKLAPSMQHLLTEYPIILKVNQKTTDVCAELSAETFFQSDQTPLIFEEPTRAYLAMIQKNLCIVFHGPKIGKCYYVFKKKLDINYIDTNIAIENLLLV